MIKVSTPLHFWSSHSLTKGAARFSLFSADVNATRYHLSHIRGNNWHDHYLLNKNQHNAKQHMSPDRRIVYNFLKQIFWGFFGHKRVGRFNKRGTTWRKCQEGWNKRLLKDYRDEILPTHFKGVSPVQKIFLNMPQAPSWCQFLKHFSKNHGHELTTIKSWAFFYNWRIPVQCATMLPLRPPKIDIQRIKVLD